MKNNPKEKILQIKKNLELAQKEYEEKRFKIISECKNEFRFNSNKTKLVRIKDIQGDILECYTLRTSNQEDFCFEEEKISIDYYLDNYYEDDDSKKGEQIIKNILKIIGKSLGVDINELFKEVSK
jgi:hypothetical protein